jgi:hypothetical protein
LYVSKQHPHLAFPDNVTHDVRFFLCKSHSKQPPAPKMVTMYASRCHLLCLDLVMNCTQCASVTIDLNHATALSCTPNVLRFIARTCRSNHKAYIKQPPIHLLDAHNVLILALHILPDLNLYGHDYNFNLPIT